jgi:hypothetical protein
MPAFQWLPTDDSPIWGWPVPRYYVEVVDGRNGDDLGRPVEAPDAEEAQIKVAEELMQDTGRDFDEVAQWVGPATRFHRYA